MLLLGSQHYTNQSKQQTVSCLNTIKSPVRLLKAYQTTGGNSAGRKKKYALRCVVVGTYQIIYCFIWQPQQKNFWFSDISKNAFTFPCYNKTMKRTILIFWWYLMCLIENWAHGYLTKYTEHCSNLLSLSWKLLEAILCSTKCFIKESNSYFGKLIFNSSSKNLWYL